ncbi:hypothetical protein ACFLTE_10635 [Bacteroidota bacterium]
MKIPIEILVALISLTGIIISIIISWLVAQYKARFEIKKLRLETQHIYAENLVKARLEKYPNVYFMLESFVKSVQKKQANYDSFNDFCEAIDKWYTCNGYLTSADTNRRFYTHLRKFQNIKNASEKAFNIRLTDNDKGKDLIRSAWEIELGLKNDLGIFELEFFNPESKFKSYDELDDILNDD